MNEKTNLVGDIKIGDHLCMIHENDDEKFSLLVPYFEIGLRNNEKCIYVADEDSSENIISEFKKRGLNLLPHIKSGQFMIMNKEGTYLTNGKFDPKFTLNLIKDSEAVALDEGYSGVRATGEMTWVLNDEIYKKQLIRYEAELNGLFNCLKFVTICLYDKNKFDKGLLVEAIHTHPIIAVGGGIFSNKYYFNPHLSEGNHPPIPASAYSIIIEDLQEGG